MIERRDILMLGGALCAVLGAKKLIACDEDGQIKSNHNSFNVNDYGASVEKSGAENLRAFRAAIAATPAGGTLVIPKHGDATYRIDTSGGFAAALLIDRPITVRLHGKLQSTHGTSGENPPYIFRVAAPDVEFSGDGSIAGPGYADDSNMQDDRCFAGLIYVTGHRFRFIGLNVTNVPKVGIHLWNCRQATVSANWIGGIKDYSVGRTGLFAIRATGGGQHKIIHNRFERDIGGRRMITAYFAGGILGGTSFDTIANNFADVHEKLAYLYTNNSTISNCVVINAIQTDIIRVIGSNNTISNINANNIKGGISVYNGINNKVIGCKLENVMQEGVLVSSMGNYSSGLMGNHITHNIIISHSEADKLQDGICVYVGSGPNADIVVSGNKISAKGKSAWKNCIRVEAVPPFFIDAVTVDRNIVSGAVNGLSMRRLRGGRIFQNQMGVLHGGEPLLRITS